MKKRLDQLLVDKKIAPSKTRAQSMILAGRILADNKKTDKAGALVDENAVIVIIGKDLPYVSRGGLKLEKALDEFNVLPKDLICLDIGASTGGFSDCLLQRGAKKVYAVDVGYGQIALKIRNDKRVVIVERTNARYLTCELLYGKNFLEGDTADMAVIDVSFISLSKILPAVYALLKKGGLVIALIKPQFEAGKEFVGKGGIIKDAQIHDSVIKKVIKDAENIGYNAIKFIASPITGVQGNKEFLIYLSKETKKIGQTNE